MQNQIDIGNHNTEQLDHNRSDILNNKAQIKFETKRINGKVATILIVAACLIFCFTLIILYFFKINDRYAELQRKNQQITITQNQQPFSPTTANVVTNSAFESVPLDEKDALVYYEFAYDKQGSLWVTDKEGVSKKKLIWSNSSPTILAIDWSPNGNKIAFTADFLSERSSKSGLYIYDGNKNEVKFIAPAIDIITSGTTSNGAWSRNSRYFSYLSGVSSGSGPLYLYDTQFDKVLTVSLPFSENLGGPVSWLASNYFYLRSWNPVQYCNSPTTDCPIEDESSAKSGFSLIQVNPATLKAEKLLTRKLTEGAIDRYFVDEINNVIYLSGRDENAYKFDIQTATTEKINLSGLDKMVFLSETYIPSPKGDKFIAINDEGMGYTSTRVVEFNTLQSKVISDYNNKEGTGIATGWYDNNTVVMSSSKIWLIDINTLPKKQLMDFVNTSVFAKVRPRLKGVKFTGTITETNNACWADGVCSIKVDDKWITAEIGGLRPPNSIPEIRGSLIGINFSQDTNKYIGKKVEVYAQPLEKENNSFTIYGNGSYYIKLLE